jgi:hypothetical protein
VHRVQRVPETESGGRIHTSAATVAVLPEAEAVDIDIPATDIRIDTMRASGAGGQHVNTTDSAVRITHIPSGIVVTSSEKSQHRNREIAMAVLRARLYDLERSRAAAERAADRKAQVGSGDRSERIRTYNFPQGRLTDHRINLTLYRLSDVMQGDLDEIIDALTADAQAAQLAEMGDVTPQEAARRLAEAGVPDPQRDARRLYDWALEQDRRREAPTAVTLAPCSRRHRLGARRGCRSRASPVARSFWKHEFEISDAVLDPTARYRNAGGNRAWRALRHRARPRDGIGLHPAEPLWPSGPGHAGLGTDISEAALEVARATPRGWGWSGRRSCARTGSRVEGAST